MIELKMDNINERIPLKKYFYGESSLINFVMILAIIIAGFIFGAGAAVAVIVACILVKIVLAVQGRHMDENLYDQLREKDKIYLKNRAINNMGLIEDEFSLIDPIVATGYAPKNSVHMGSEIIGRKRDFISLIFDMIKYTLKAIPMMFYNFYLEIIGKAPVLSQSIFFEGNDKKVRGSLISFCVTSFTEKQIISYTCNYDIALGIILEEYTREVFYRDVDSVNYGDETIHIMSEGEIIKVPSTWMRLAVSSGSDIYASATGENELLENQVTAMKNLIRSKKEEMT